MSKVLIIEDDSILQAGYSTKLIKEGFEVETARDGEEGLIKAASFNPNIILLDILLPKMSGVEFLKKYNPKVLHPDVKVLVFSALTIEEIRQKTLALGADEFLTKATVSPNDMVDIINSLTA